MFGPVVWPAALKDDLLDEVRSSQVRKCPPTEKVSTVPRGISSNFKETEFHVLCFSPVGELSPFAFPPPPHELGFHIEISPVNPGTSNARDYYIKIHSKGRSYCTSLQLHFPFGVFATASNNGSCPLFPMKDLAKRIASALRVLIIFRTWNGLYSHL